MTLDEAKLGLWSELQVHERIFGETHWVECARVVLAALEQHELVVRAIKSVLPQADQQKWRMPPPPPGALPYDEEGES